MTSYDPAASYLLVILEILKAKYDGLWIHENLTAQVNDYIIHEAFDKKRKEKSKVFTRHRRARAIWEYMKGELEEMDRIVEELNMRIGGQQGFEKYGRFPWQGKALEVLEGQIDRSVSILEERLGPLERCTDELWEELEKEMGKEVERKDGKCWTQTRPEWEAAQLAQRNEPKN